MSDCCGSEETSCCTPPAATGASCCTPPAAPQASCCGTPADDFDYGPAPYLSGEVDTFAGPIPRLSTVLTPADARGGWRVRAGSGRNAYRVRPGLYALGEPDDTSPVLVTGNYKLTVDVVREALHGRDLWLLVVDTKGINVWCSAGKGVFSTDAVAQGIADARLEQIVSHQKLVLPQLSATGVAAHEVRARTGFSVAWGPVRAGDIGEYLDSGLKATDAMRRVEFPLSERAKLVGVELSVLWRPRWLVAGGAVLAAAGALAYFAPAYAPPVAALVAAAAISVVAGAGITPLLLPWVPGRAFAFKGALVGAAVLATFSVAAFGVTPPLWVWGLVAAGAALASFIAMNFTGSSTFTSPSGVEWEMRRAIPAELVGAVVGVALYVVGLLGIGG